MLMGGGGGKASARSQNLGEQSGGALGTLPIDFGGGPKPKPAPPPLDVLWKRACLQPEGVLQASQALQVGFKADFRGYAGRLGIYFGNLTPAPLKVVSIEAAVPPATGAALTCTAEPAPDRLEPGRPVRQMISLELFGPFAAPPYLIVTLQPEAGGEPLVAAVNLPVIACRFGSPWPLGKDDYFGMWRTSGLKEAQAKFTFNQAHEVGAIKQLLSAQVKLAILEGVDPSPNNICAAGAVVCKNGVMPPAAGGHHCLLRLEIIPNYAKAPDGTPRAASRLTVRSTHQAVAETLVAALTAYLGGQ